MLKMKKVLFVIMSVIFSSSMLFGQDSEFDSRLLVKYSVKELNKIEKENPAEIKFLAYCLDNGYTLGDYPTEKDGKFDIDGAIEIDDITQINLYQLDIEIKDGRNQMYSVNGKSKLLIVYDSKFLRNKFTQNHK